MRGSTWTLALLLALASCLSAPLEESSPEDRGKKPWRFEELTLGSQVADPTVSGQQPSGQEELTPGLNPDLAANKRTMLPGGRIRNPDGSIELVFFVPHVGKKEVASHYIALIEKYCRAQVGPGGPAVLYSHDPKAIAALKPPARAVRLEAIDTTDQVFSDPKMTATGKFRAQFPAFISAKAPLTDAILARGHPDDIDALETFVQNFIVDVDQIEVTARIVESGVEDLHDFGALTKLTPVNPDKLFFRGLQTEFDNESGAGGVLVLKGIQDALELESTLRLLKQRVGVKLRAEPRVILRNGGTAALVRGDKVPVQVVTAVSASGTISTGIAYKDVGLQLRISAFAVGRDAVFLDLQVQSGNISGFTTIGSVTNPLLTNRMARTSVILKQGQTLVIGGLITKQVEKRESKVPLLGDIPLLGFLFRSTFEKETTSEVNFLFTPRVLAGRFDVAPFG